MTQDELKQFVLEVFNNTIGNINNVNKEICAKYFSEDYIQYVDGKTLTFHGFVNHMNALKDVMSSITITFKHMLVDDDKVATVHIVDGMKRDGQAIKAQVNAVFQIRDKKIVMCNELTHILEGEKSDQDLGSRH